VSSLDDALRPMIAELVRVEVARVLAKRERTDGEGFMSTTDAAAYAGGVALGTVRRWIREGKLPAHHAGRHLRVRRADLDALLVGERRVPELSPEELARREFGG